MFNIDSNGQAINVLGSSPNEGMKPPKYSKKEKRQLFVEEDDGAKVAAIAAKIRELT